MKTHTTSTPVDPSSPTASCVVASPIGPLTVTATDAAVVSIAFGDTTAGTIDDPPEDAADHPILWAAAVQLQEYFDGVRTEFDLPLAPHGTEFQTEAWAVLRAIPYGETITYGEQAKRLGDRNKSRAVGAANGKNPIPIVVPCHRVVGSNGHLTGFAGGLDTKAWLLDHERRISTGLPGTGN